MPIVVRTSPPKLADIRGKLDAMAAFGCIVAAREADMCVKDEATEPFGCIVALRLADM